MLYDMDKGALPLKLKMDHIDRIVEVNQLAYREGGKIDQMYFKEDGFWNVILVSMSLEKCL